jgi:hypothetical protein
LLCSCSNLGYEFKLDGQDGTTACDTMLDVCDEPVEATFEDAEVDCRPEFQSGGSGYCETQEQCLRSVALGDGISVSQRDYLQVICQTGANGGSSCSCSSSSGGFRIDSEEPVTGVASCTSLADVCSGLDGIEFSGEPTCSTVNQAARGDTCTAQRECGVSATVRDKQVKMFGYVNISCSPDGTAWSCTCSSGANTAQVPAQGASAWDACTNASEPCADATEVDFSGGGMVGVPPPGLPFPG